jgi:hypothetical protein
LGETSLTRCETWQECTTHRTPRHWNGWLREVSNRPKLPPLAQPGDGTPEGEALARIKETLAGPPDGFLTEAEYVAMMRRSSPALPIFEQAKKSVVLERRGKLVWRIPGKAGADYDRSPLAVVIVRQQQCHEAELAKIDREMRLMQSTIKGEGVCTRQSRAQALRNNVLFLAEQYLDAGRKSHELASLIAKRLGITARHARRILNKEKTDMTENRRF